MTVISLDRGHRIYWDRKIQKWRYKDTGEIANSERPCIRCGQPPTSDGHDTCLGDIPGITSACCGHGIEEPYEVRK